MPTSDREGQIFGQLLLIQHALGEHAAKLDRLQVHVEGLNTRVANLQATASKIEDHEKAIARLDTESGETETIKAKAKGAWMMLTVVASLIAAGVSLAMHLLGK